MKFCSKCDNLYYFKLDNDNSKNLVYYCRNCGHETVPEEKQIYVSKIKTNTEKKHSQFINSYTKYDPTLPRINTLPCVNESCDFHKSKKNREIIYIRYDEQNMKYVYLCTKCNTSWIL